MRLQFEIKFLHLRSYFCNNVTDLRGLAFVVTDNLETFSN